jgi:spore maturation protein CgeB
MFRPLCDLEREGDLVWIGNWGDGERTGELHEFLIDPVRRLSLSARIHGVRYPEEAERRLREVGIEYAGWLPNYRVPQVFSRFRCTVHIPRRPYVAALPGVPTIRVFEALACGIPLLSAPWSDSDGLFTPGADFLMVKNGEEMTRRLRDVLNDPALADALATHGLHTILSRHTCGHRVDQLLAIVRELQGREVEGAVPA